MAVGSTQPLTETGTRNLSQPVSQFPRKCENLDISQLSGPPWPVTGIALPSLHISDISDILYKTLHNHEILLLSFINGLCYIHSYPFHKLAFPINMEIRRNDLQNTPHNWIQT
jgi:hypothetical protein